MYRIGPDEIAAATRVLSSGKLFRHGTGPGGEPTEAQLFEREWADSNGVAHALALPSGTAALIAGLVGLGIAPGDEVIVPGYTYVATALAPLAIGAVPVLAEVDASLMLDPQDLAAKITDRTTAVIPVHVHGHVADLAPVMDVARQRGLKVLQDCAQCIGGSYRGAPVGSVGDASAFSFNFFKILAAGEGGVLGTSDPAVIARARAYCDPGDEAWWPDATDVHVDAFAGVTYRVDELRAAVLRAQLGRLDAIRSALRERWSHLRSELAGAAGVDIAPVLDDGGDCGTSLILRLPTRDAATAFTGRATKRGLDVVHTIEFGCHVYRNWAMLMERRGAHHPDVDPLRITEAGRARRYTPDMLPRTIAHLERSVLLMVDIDWTPDDVRRAANAVREAAGSR